MSETLALEILLVLVLILMNAFFAASEMALVTVRKGRVRDLAEKGVRGATTTLRLLDNPGRFLATIQVGVTTAGFFASAVGATTITPSLAPLLASTGIPLLAPNAEVVVFIGVTLLITYLSLVLGELVPKNLAIHGAERMALVFGPIIDFLSRLARPLVAALTLSTNGILRIFGIRGTIKAGSVTADEIESMVDAGEEEGSIDTQEADMIKGVFELGETRVREIMRPRLDIVAIHQDAPLHEGAELVRTSGKSRLPVYGQSIDDIVGLISAKDLLTHFGRDANGHRVSDLMRPASFVPEGKLVDELLQEMRTSRQHLAIVLDEFGGTAGLVTLEDIVEEVVGEIEDETDLTEDIEIQQVSPEELVVHGRVGIDEVNELLEIRIEKDGFDSVGGLIMHTLGRLPDEGEQVETEEAALDVLRMKGNRIDLVRIRRRVPLESGEPEPAPAS